MFFLVLSLVTLAASEPILIGELKEKNHDVNGKVFAVDESHILIKDFRYDGQGPDAFFWVGTEGLPSGVPDDKTLILTEDKHYQYRDQSAPVLGKYDGKDVTLALPASMKLSTVKWISIWCRLYSVDFGNLIFPDSFQVPGSTPTTTGLPPPFVPPSSPETEPESEPESEPEGEPEPKKEPETGDESGASSGNLSSVVAVLLALVCASIFV